MGKKKEKSKKDEQVKLVCPDCGCSSLVTTNTKIHRFPNTHLFKFECGFAYLYNSKKDQIYLDIDWQCSKKKDGVLRVSPSKKFNKKYVELSKKTLSRKKKKEDK